MRYIRFICDEVGLFDFWLIYHPNSAVKWDGLFFGQIIFLISSSLELYLSVRTWKVNRCREPITFYFDIKTRGHSFIKNKVKSLRRIVVFRQYTVPGKRQNSGGFRARLQNLRRMIVRP